MKIYVLVIFLLATAGKELRAGAGGNSELTKSLAANYKMPPAYVNYCFELYNELGLAERGLEREIFLQAYKGFLVLQGKGLVRNSRYLSIADFSQSNRNKRLYIVDLRHRKLMVQTYVSHGKNSGEEMATSFSNVNNSNKSVLGFLITEGTYTGSNGLSLRFRGMERGINDLVTMRSIVVHGSKFVNDRTLEERGAMVNSLGCPAVPMAQSRTIIEAIKGGSVYFIYHPDELYAAKSPILKASLNPTLTLPSQYLQAATDSLQPPTSNGLVGSVSAKN